MSDTVAAPSVVVGIDGSRSAVRAALWAMDEAISRDIPLRLVSIVESPEPQPDHHQHGNGVATAELAVRYAHTAVESAGRPVKTETEILHGPPVATLIETSASAAMVCIGALGLRHFAPDRVGSTARALVTSAHCPVAIVRGSDQTMPKGQGQVVVELDESPSGAAVLIAAVEESRLRGAPLRVLGSRHTPNSPGDGDQLIRIQLDRRLAQWRRLYPDLDLEAVAVHGTALNYLSENADSIQLIVVGADDADAVEDVLGPAGSAALQLADCSVLVIDRQRLL